MESKRSWLEGEVANMRGEVRRAVREREEASTRASKDHAEVDRLARLLTTAQEDRQRDDASHGDVVDQAARLERECGDREREMRVGLEVAAVRASGLVRDAEAASIVMRDTEAALRRSAEQEKQLRQSLRHAKTVLERTAMREVPPTTPPSLEDAAYSIKREVAQLKRWEGDLDEPTGAAACGFNPHLSRELRQAPASPLEERIARCSRRW